jgi:hypothetical protein
MMRHESFRNLHKSNSPLLIESVLSDISRSHNFSLISFNRLKVDVGLSFNAPMIRNWISNERKLLAFGFEPSLKNFISLQSLDNSIV